jgi:hypothetical protein
LYISLPILIINTSFSHADGTLQSREYGSAKLSIPRKSGKELKINDKLSVAWLTP